MTSRERLLNTIYRKETDRVPISVYELCQFEGSSSAGFANHEPSYKNLLGVIAEKTDCIMMSEVDVKYPEIEKLTENKQWREGKSIFYETIIHTPKGPLTSKARRDDNIFTTWQLKHFFDDIDDIEKYKSLDFSFEVNTDKVMSDNKKVGEHGIVMPTLEDPVCRAASLFNMEDFLVFSITDTEEMQEFLNFIWDVQKQVLAETLKSDVEDIMFRIVGPEYATPPYLPDKYFNSFVTQYVKQMCSMIKDAKAIPRVHSHGKVRHALSEFAQTQAMCVEPLEPIPDGDISLAEIKQLYGGKFTLMGNIELKALEYLSTDEIDAMVKDVLADGKKDGGFILMPTATPINTPLNPKTEENFIAMIEAGHKYGQY